MKQGKPAGGQAGFEAAAGQAGLSVLPLQLDAVHTLLLCNASCSS
jgi:hypothetical protein